MAKVCDECGGEAAYNEVNSCHGLVDEDLCDKCYKKWQDEKPERQRRQKEEYDKKASVSIKKKEDALVEEIAPFEHKQWAHWTKYMLDNLTEENIARWRKQIDTEYKDLSEEEKESDRVWARKLLVIDKLKPRIGRFESMFW